ncbi:CMRF35-like molecule 6 isoform X2 [Hoplias malabaricus]|uniref:CMRF35-like molecule 6 isoform X2 n=1 Tax=Hoplias malabaricus TaxID=27720 RepID=UPI0034636479
MNMKLLLIFSLYLISAAGGSMRVRGFSGGGVLIKCRYETQYTSNTKFFCKSSAPKCVDQIKTDVKNAWVNSGRFSLFDDTSAAVFWVKIRDLTVEDSGTYQCAVDKILLWDSYTPVELNVEEEQEPAADTSTSNTTPQASTKTTASVTRESTSKKTAPEKGQASDTSTSATITRGSTSKKTAPELMEDRCTQGSPPGGAVYESDQQCFCI